MQKNINIRSYQVADIHQCLELLDGNTPKFFAQHERLLFERFLEKNEQQFFCLEQNSEILACGGFWSEMHGVNYLAWGMVANKAHHQGLGSQLLQYRLDKIRQIPLAWCVLIHTSQHSAPFFEKHGFEIYHVLSNGYTQGLDQLFMRLIFR